MAMPKRIKVEFGEAFPHGVFAVSEITKLRDFDRSTKDHEVQAVDEDTGLLLWTGDFLDADPTARKADRQFSVRIAAKVKPMLPGPVADLPFPPVEFEGLTATPYVASTTSEDNGKAKTRSRLAWSFRATGLRAPSTRAGKASGGSAGGS